MDLILCHQTADFDALGAAVGLTRLIPGSKIVLTGGAHPGVKSFLGLHRDEFSLIERRSVNPQQIGALHIVDTQHRSRLGKAAEWLDLEHLDAVVLYDHHLDSNGDIEATERQIERVGAITTLIVEQLQSRGVRLTPPEATVMALGIHLDTGSLTFAQTTARDAIALAWLLGQNASLQSISEYCDRGLSPRLQTLLAQALETLQKQTVYGYTVAWVLLQTEDYVAGLSGLTMSLLDVTEVDGLILAHEYQRRKKDNTRLAIIGRSRIPQTDLNSLLQEYGGGGHAQAASANLRDVDAESTLNQIVQDFQNQIPQPLTARDLMSSPVRTIRPQTTIGEAQRILLRYGHSGLSVVDERDRLVGIISRRDLDLALHHGFSHAPVKGYMSRNLRTIDPHTPLPEIEAIMVTYDVGRLPILEDNQLIGIVTRTDILRQRHQDAFTEEDNTTPSEIRRYPSLERLKNHFNAYLWQFLQKAALAAQNRGWHLYLVGGAVRDLLLVESGIRDNIPLLQDIDLVVDGFHQAAEAGAGVELAKALQKDYPDARLEVHGAFQTAALLWHEDPQLGSLALDIATARTEFYPYPAANPEVEASSIRQDLYRRDFTINAMALRLSQPRQGEILDFFGGLLDLRSRLVRVLHANSFIEDPTRIYRAVRFAVRLGFDLEEQTEAYIRYAIESGVYDRSKANNKAPALTTRLKAELKYLLEAPYWKPALQLIASLGALRCLHPELYLSETLWWQIRLLDRGLRRFDPENRLTHWQMRLEVILAAIPEGDRITVAQNLQLPADSIKRLEHLATTEKTVIDAFHIPTPKYCLRPSEVVKLLREYKMPILVLLAVRTPRPIRRQIWQYLTTWSHIEPPLNGNDLKQLGYKPGPQYRTILDNLLMAYLDGMIRDRAEAEAFLGSESISNH
ncbi:MAG: CBS domain-containing protein [Jaaginema sp. PMC 1079.18]|nr:CBS domain-containing protein [Jaaginema sp. PMC 1080.18]MEC4853610.1 CBS domain-containing protein [Jaaginema sp. PMC 1079.18]MEC4868152.1 CBS domain-containing protein [Jaaginema sp. PMC 1078.18]